MATKGARWPSNNLKIENGIVTEKPKPKKVPANGIPRLAETDLQYQLIQWFAHTHPKLYRRGTLIAIPNAGKRGRKAAKQMKREGLWKGAADLVLFLPRGKFHGAVLEMKADGGVVSDDQSEWLEYRSEDGYHAGVAWTYDDGTRFFDEYLALE